MSYSIDLYCKEVEPEKNYFTYLTYVSMFPQLIVGPIVRFATVQRSFMKELLIKKVFVRALQDFCRGLLKRCS